MTDTKDKVQPSGKWEFDESVANAFDDMLKRSIPQYEEMRAACTSIALKYAQDKTDVVDLGCSRGEASASLISKRGAHNRFVLVEVSEPMKDVCRQRFAGYIDAGVVELRSDDLRTCYPPASASVTLCILTLQFTPIEHRLRILSDIYNSTIGGGALIIVEKVIGSTAPIDQLLVDLYYESKRHHGYSQEDIDRKRMSLEGVLVPVTARWNEELLQMTGFKQVECFWRWMNFAGWVAIK